MKRRLLTATGILLIVLAWVAAIEGIGKIPSYRLVSDDAYSNSLYTNCSKYGSAQDSCQEDAISELADQNRSLVFGVLTLLALVSIYLLVWKYERE